MSGDKDGGPAFPTRNFYTDGHQIIEGQLQGGMTLRDYFAGKALQGILAGPCSRVDVTSKDWMDSPEWAYKIADAMLAARTKERPGK